MNIFFSFENLIFFSVMTWSLWLKETQGGIGLGPLDFFRFSNEELARETPIVFRPGDGMKLRERFEKKYGLKGEALVRSLGEGTEIDEKIQLPKLNKT